MKKKKKQKVKDSLQLEYSGQVTVQVVRNDRVIKTITGHNSGTYRLFEFIAKCLANVYEGTYSPRYLQGFYATNSDDISTNDKDSLTGIVAISSSAYKSDKLSNFGTASLTFAIPGQIFDSDDPTKIPNLFALYSTAERLNNANPLAVYYMEEPITGISDDTNVIIVRNLIVGNKQ